jgi:hypothetical protein
MISTAMMCEAGWQYAPGMIMQPGGGYNNDLRGRKPKEVCMTREELLNRISINPEICFGKAMHSGTPDLGFAHPRLSG